MFVVTFDLCDISSASLVAKKLVVYKSGELTDRRDVGGPGHGATAVCVCVCVCVWFIDLAAAVAEE